MKTLIPVEVEWIDAHSSLNPMTINELEEQEPILTKSCGYLIKEDKEKIVLGFMCFGVNINDEILLKHYQVIPKGMVKKIIKLEEIKVKRKRRRLRYYENKTIKKPVVVNFRTSDGKIVGLKGTKAIRKPIKIKRSRNIK